MKEEEVEEMGEGTRRRRRWEKELGGGGRWREVHEGEW